MTMRELLRLFYRHIVDFIPVVDKEGKLQGVLLKDKVVGLTGGDLRDIDRPLDEDIIASFLDKFEEAKQFLPMLADRGETRIPVLRKDGGFFGFWSNGELLEAIGGKRVLSASFLTPLLEEIPLALGLFNKTGDFIYMNASFKDLLSDVEARKWHECKIGDFLKKPKKEEIQASFAGKSWSGLLVPLHGMENAGGAFIWDDITDLEKIVSRALQLAALQKGFEKLFDFMKEGFWCIDKEGRVLFSNRSFESIFGLHLPRGKSAKETFGSEYEDLPIVKSLKTGEMIEREEILRAPSGKRLSLKRKAMPIKVGAEVIGAMEILFPGPVRGVPSMGEWLELGEVSKEAFSEAINAFEKGSIFIWGPPGVGKTHLGVATLSGADNVFFLDGVIPNSLRSEDIIFVENLDSFSDEDRDVLFDLISRHRSVVTSRLPPAHYSLPIKERFEAIIHLPPICERWEEAEKFLNLKSEGIEVEEALLSRLKQMRWERNFHDLIAFLKKLALEGNRGLNGFLGEKLTLKEALEKREREIIEEALSSCGGNITKAAKILGIPRQTLQYKLRKFGIKG